MNSCLKRIFSAGAKTRSKSRIYRVRLSKFLSFVLRHAPERFQLRLDKNGCAQLDEVLGILKARFRHFKKEDLFDLIEKDEKGRFEILSDKIRARYGHSVAALPRGKVIDPPDILYHGTSEESARKIIRDGLKPMGRQFVHLSLNEDDAFKVGLRHARRPVILKIAAKKASASGVEFFKEENILLAKEIPKDYIVTA